VGCRTILGLILVAIKPLPPSSMDDILGLKQGCIHFLKYLGSVLQWNDTETRILHPSFHDFLSNPERCRPNPCYVDMTLHHSRIAHQCIELMQQKLREFTPNLLRNGTIQPCPIPNSVSYASTSWIEHVCRSNTVNAELVYGFLSRHLLDWMEVLSAQGQFRLAITDIEQLRKLPIHVRCPLSSFSRVNRIGCIHYRI
jgi:hypothetical protein